MSTVPATDPTNGSDWKWNIPDTTAAAAAKKATNPDGSIATAGGAMGKDQFVKLLVAQMKNQDPMSPMDGKDLAVQLAQFSSVEQLMNMNTKLDDLTAALKSSTPKTPQTTV
jgi:flagellar basal-body rod modification protein FlgD